MEPRLANMAGAREEDAALGFVGLGVMGGAQSSNLLRTSGRPLLVFDLDSAKVAKLRAEGAAAADSIGHIAQTCDIIFLSLPGRQHLDSVVHGPEGLLANARPGQIVVDMSTSPVPMVRQLAEEFTAVGATFIDAPVARTRQAAIDGTLAIMVGAPDQTAFARVEPYLRCMGSDVTHCGPVGAGALVKLLNNLIVCETVVALAEALTIARRSNLISDELLFEVLGSSSAGSFALESHGKKALVPDAHPEQAFSTKYMLKDVEYALEWAAEVGVETSVGALAKSLLTATCDAGYGDLYHTAVVRVIEAKGA